MKTLIILASLAAVAVAELSDCSTLGNPALWLSVNINNPSLGFIDSATAGRNPGLNFCLGNVEGDTTRFQIRAYADPSCTVQSNNFYERTVGGAQHQRQGQCGDFDYDAPSCAEFGTRELAKLVAAQSSTTQAFVDNFQRVTANKDWAVAAVSFNPGPGYTVQQVVYTDSHVCSMEVTLQNSRTVIFLATNLRPINPVPRKSAAAPVAQPDERLSACAVSDGYWTEVTYTGLGEASFGGQFSLGKNFCITNSLQDNTMTMLMKQTLTCDPGLGARNQNTMLTTHARDIIDDNGQCRYDYTYGQCVNDRLKSEIVKIISNTKDTQQITDELFSYLSAGVGNTRSWAVLVTEMIQGEPFSIARTLRSDPNHCFVIYNTDDKTFTVLATQVVN